MTWYYLQNGKPVGPVSQSHLQKEIAVGRIGPRDLLYCEQDTKWREAQSFDDFKEFFNGESKETDWVLLLKKSDGSGYKQKGPLKRVHILALLSSGEVGLDDHVWRKGLKEWYKISAVPEFIEPLKKNEKTLPPLPDDADLPLDLSEQTQSLRIPDLLKSEVSQSNITLAPITQISSQPTSHSAPSVTQSAITDSKVMQTVSKFERTETQAMSPIVNSLKLELSQSEIQERRSRKHYKRSRSGAQAQAHFVRRMSLVVYFLDLTPVKKILFVLGAGVVASACFVLSTYLTTFLDIKNLRLKNPKFALSSWPPAPAPVRAPPAVAPVNSGVTVQPPTSAAAPIQEAFRPQVSPTAVREQNEGSPTSGDSADRNKSATLKEAPVQELRVKPTFIRLEALEQGSAQAGFKVITDGSRHFPIRIAVKGEGGHIVDEKNIYRTTRIKKIEERDVRLNRWGLPMGRYEVDVDVEGLQSEISILYNAQGDDYNRRLAESRKKLIYYHNEERYGFIKTISRIENETQNLLQNVSRSAELKSWQGFYKSWRKNFDRINSGKLSSFSAKSRKNYVHPGLWQQLKDLNARIGTLSKLSNKQKSSGHTPDSKEIRSAVSDLAKLKEQMMQRSLWN